MKTYDYLIIGNGIAGVTAAETVREHDQSGTIAIVSHEPHLLYSRVLLPSYLKRRIPREKVFLRKIEDFYRRRIDLYLREIVGDVDTARKQIDCTGGLSLGYKKLLIASGGSVQKWSKDEEGAGVYRLQTIDDADQIYNLLSLVKSPMVVGASFISLEFLEILTLNKTPPTLIIRDTHFLGRLLDEQGGRMLEENFAAKKIEVRREDEIVERQGADIPFRIRTKTGNDVTTDALFLGTGIERNITFLSGSGIALGRKGIRTNEYLETTVEHVFAAGDVAEYVDVITGGLRVTGNWTSAFLQGKNVGLTMAGKRTRYKNVPAYSITNLGFQITALGEIEDTSDTIVAYDPTANRYARFFLKQGVLSGAALINRFQDKAYLTELIETKSPLHEFRDKLSSPQFDIREIPVVR